MSRPDQSARPLARAKECAATTPLVAHSTNSDRAEVLKCGAFDMQVCVPKHWTDDQVVAFAGRENFCGTENGWQIRRKGDEALAGSPERMPCASKPLTHVHIMLDA